MIKWIFGVALAHITMPVVCFMINIFLIEYWSRYLFGFSPTKAAAKDNSVALVFWVVFILFHCKFAIDWWFFQELSEE